MNLPYDRDRSACADPRDAANWSDKIDAFRRLAEGHDGDLYRTLLAVEMFGADPLIVRAAAEELAMRRITGGAR